MRTKSIMAVTVVALGAAIFSSVYNLSDRTSAQANETFDGNIILGRPTDSSVTVNVLFTANQDAVYLEYGDKSGELLRQTAVRQSVRANAPYEEVIGQLEPNRRYYYRVRFRGVGQTAFGASAEHSFQTQRPPGSAFTFTLVADSHLFTPVHCDPQRYALALANARDDNPDFHIDLGDTFRTDTITRDPMDTTYQLVVERMIAHRPFFGILTHSAPLFLVEGNHDSEYLYYTKPESGENPNLPLWCTNARLALFPNPRPDNFYTGDTAIQPGVDGGLRETYYAWEWGDALFVVLDPYWEMPGRGGMNWDPVHGDRQFAWFRDTLRNSRAKYKFVFEHHLHGQSRGGIEVAPFYEWGGRDKNGNNTFPQNRPGWVKPFQDLMAESGVSVYFQGHDHLFARGVYNGVTYISVPMPGAGPDPAGSDYFPGNEVDGNFDAYPASVVLPNSGHVRVRVTPDAVRIEYVQVKLPKDSGTNKMVAYSVNVGRQDNPTLVSSACFAGIGAAAESLVSAFGAGMAGVAGAGGPTTVSVRDSAGVDRQAQVMFASPSQVNFLVPAGTANGQASVTVSNGVTQIGPTSLSIDRVAPALFTANSNGLGVPAAFAVHVRADGSQSAELVFRCGTAPGSCVATPIDLGPATDQVYLVLFGTGIRNRAQISDIAARLGGEPAEVQFAGVQPDYPGLDQLNLKIPRSLAGRGAVSVIFSAAGRSSTPVTVNIK